MKLKTLLKVLLNFQKYYIYDNEGDLIFCITPFELQTNNNYDYLLYQNVMYIDDKKIFLK